MPGVSLDAARGPDGIRLYAIGDVHGRQDLLMTLHRTIRAEIERDRPSDWRIIHLGDYVDRGLQSRAVLDMLVAVTGEDARQLALVGNHDIGFLDFLERPSFESLFMRFGGIETALSYGVCLEGDRLSDLYRFHGKLEDAVPSEHRDFLAMRPFSVAFGDYFFCHAGIRPGVPLDRQEPEDLIWIRGEFLDHDGAHDKVVVHGHTIVERAELLPNRVNVDTGAWRSGVLTALVIDGNEKRLISTGP